MRKDTSKMTTAEIATYLASQKEKGWPGSRSITSRVYQQGESNT